MIKTLIKKLTPPFLLQTYHYLLALLGSFWYGRPSRKLIVIGVTGTKGKSTTANCIAQLLERTGHTVGLSSTVIFKVGKREWLNNKKMTMLGRFQTQRLLRDMVREHCTHAVIETSSEGISQFRHIGIDYDVAVFTNLYPEHIESHGSFENYRAAKEKLFAGLSRSKRKKLHDTTIKKTIIVNADDPESSRIRSYPADTYVSFGSGEGADVRVADVRAHADGTSLSVNGVATTVPLLGSFNAMNVAAAVATCRTLGVPESALIENLSRLTPVPGRQEFVPVPQSFRVLVDYAYEPKSQEQLYELLNIIPHERIIHVTGSAGGGRDKSRRRVLGELAGGRADIVIVTNEDPYDEDPTVIIEAVAVGARAANKKDNVDLFVMQDRGEAIRKALTIGKKGDLIIVTGKGAEQAICVAHGKKLPWDDRVIIKQEAQQLYDQAIRKE